ncbi:amidase domain-containing protein [Agromyces kandeliae]|uniref:CHAP domain-containing protein n=1 Tax=Agromyces kandeliae TaxID=2666141 RepID=A0A6L5R0X8_9MICO|nr:amidase domain-containing protein [Agromyces kandeliae]MRX43098.1 CHAP domain-containing protein [Agromyces kandeliae]
MPRNFLLPAHRRSTYRAPEPDAARDFDLTQPPGSADSDERRSAALAAVRAELDLPAPEIAALSATRPETARSTFTAASTADASASDSTVPDPAEPVPPVVETPIADTAVPGSPTGGDQVPGPPAGDLVVDDPAATSVDSTVPDPAEPTTPDAGGADAGARADGVRTLGGGYRFPRHRADRRGNRRPSSGSRRPLIAACAAFLLGGAIGGGALVSGMDDPARADASARGAAIDELAASAADDVVIPPVVQDDRPVVTSELSASEAPFTGGTEVTVRGRNLDRVAQVSVAGTPAEIVDADAVAITFAVPEVDDSVRGGVDVVLAEADGSVVDVEVPVASAPASVTTSVQGIVEASAPLAADEVDRAALSITYTDDPGIEAQVSYVLAHWSDYNTAQYAVLSGVDCANFASQSLIARGWTMDAAWNYDRGTGQMTSAWSSSTALRDYLRTRTDVATELTDAERARVKVGDIAQFDWDGSGDRDHTAVVTRVEHTDAGTRVWVGGHTKDADYWDVDVALATGGGSVSYFSLS